MKKNLFYNIILTLSQFVLPLISFPYASRIIGPNGIGAVNFVDSFTQYFVLISALGIPYYGIREIAKVKENPTKKQYLFNEILSIHVISALAFSLFYIGMAFLIPQMRQHFSLVLIGATIILSNTFTLEWFFQGIGEYSYITIRSVIVRTVSVILLFILLKRSDQTSIYYLLLASTFILNGISNLLYVRKKTNIQFKGLNMKQHIRPLIVILGSSLAISVYVYVDNILLGFIKGDAAVGFYSTSVKIVKIPLALLSAVSAIIIPQISQSYHEQNFDKIKSLIDKSFSFVCIIGLPLTFGLALNAKFLITMFAGSKFVNAVIITQILSPAIFIIGLNNLFGVQILTPIGKEKYLLYSVGIGMITSLTCNIILIPYLSYIGSALANVFTELVVTLLCFYYSQKLIGYKLNLKVFYQSLIASALFIPISWAVNRLNISTLYIGILIICTCSLTYALFFTVFFKNQYIDNVKQGLLKKISIK